MYQMEGKIVLASLQSSQNSSEECAFLSTATVRLGSWEIADCTTKALGFLCQVPMPALPPAHVQLRNSSLSPSLSLEQLTVGDGNSHSACPPGSRHYLDTCYRLLDVAPTSYQGAVVACREWAGQFGRLIWPSNALEFAFVRYMLKGSLHSVWIDVEATKYQV